MARELGFSGTHHNKEVGQYDNGSLSIMNRYVGSAELAPVQTESGGKGKEEMVSLPSLDIIPVNATKRHSKMDDDEVTDLLPEGSYVFSQFGLMLNKSEADNVVTEVSSNPYDIFSYKDNKVPTEKSLGDLFSSKKESPADIARKIGKKFNTVDKNDPFTIRANEENRISSLPYIQGLILMSEIEKKKQGLEADIPMLEQFGAGGRVQKRENVAKAFLPAAVAVPAAVSLLNLGVNFFSGQSEKKQIEKLRNQNISENNQVAATQQNNNQFALMGSLAALGLQDPTIEAPQLGYDRLNQQQDNLSQGTVDGIANRAFLNIPTRDVFNNTGSFQRGVQGIAPAIGAAAANQSTVAFQNAQLGLQNKNARLGNIQNIVNQQAGLDTNAANATRQGQNALIAGAGSAFAGYAQTDSNIIASRASANAAARGAAFNAVSQVNQGQRDSLNNTTTALTQLYLSNAANTADATNDTVDTSSNGLNTSTAANSIAPNFTSMQTGPVPAGYSGCWGGLAYVNGVNNFGTRC